MNDVSAKTEGAEAVLESPATPSAPVPHFEEFKVFPLSKAVERPNGSSITELTLRSPNGLDVFERYRGVPLCSLSDLPVQAPHNIANALAAAALARQLNFDSRRPVPAAAVAEGLSAYRPGPHRNAVVSTIDGVAYVDDSKATNAHAAAASLSAYDNVVWIAGGLLKGAVVDDLIVEHRGRLRGVVVIGADRTLVRDALARHAPDVPVVEVDATDTGAMTAAVSAARRLASPGDTVLLAPAAASMDMFRDYAERGDVFAAAVRRLAEGRE